MLVTEHILFWLFIVIFLSFFLINVISVNSVKGMVSVKSEKQKQKI